MTEKEKKVVLPKMTIAELLELRERQIKLLNNRSFISKLPDKGARIKDFFLKIDKELERRKHPSVNDITDIMSKFQMNGVSEKLEWTGKLNGAEERLDSDDDEDDVNVDPLKLIATHSGTQTSRVHRIEKTDEPLINEKDIADSLSYVESACKKHDSIEPRRERFKPNQPKNVEEMKTGFKSSSEFVRKRLGEHWEVTAATPPVPLFGDAKPISLAESLVLQKEQAEKLRKIQLQQATQRLQQMSSGASSSTSVTNPMAHRKPPDPCFQFEGSTLRIKNEEHDEFAQVDE